MNEILKIGKLWKELYQKKRKQPAGTFFDQPFKSYSSCKVTCLKMKFKNRSVFYDLRFVFFLNLDFNWPPFLNGLR